MAAVVQIGGWSVFVHARSARLVGPGGGSAGYAVIRNLFRL